MTLEEKIANADRVDLHYKPPYKTSYAIVKYHWRQGQPFKVAGYHIYGEELKSGKPLICWEWLPSTNFVVVEDGFISREEATVRIKELRVEHKKTKE